MIETPISREFYRKAIDMYFENKVGLLDFAEEVQNRLKESYTRYNYREDVAKALDQHKARYWPNLEAPKMPEIWIRWLSEAQDKDWFVGRNRQITSITESTIRDLRKGEGLTERAIAIHYRMHRSLDGEELALALTLDQAVFGCSAAEIFGTLFEFQPPDMEDFDGVNFAPALAELSGVDWTQMPSETSNFELEAELFCRQSTQSYNNTRRLRYGLREVWLRVRTDHFDVLKHYRGGQQGQPSHLHFHGKNTWRINASDGPIDNFGMLDGSALAGPICLGVPTKDENSKLDIDVFIPKKSPKLTILDGNSDDEIKVDDEERRNLIEKMFLIYLHKLNKLDSEHVILSSTQVST